MIVTETSYWSSVINVILHSYFSDLTTTCVLRHKEYDLLWTSAAINSNVYLQINPWTLNESFSRDIHNFDEQDKQYTDDGIYYDDWVKKYVAAITQANCEGFLVFQDDIPRFAQTYRMASVYSIWRSYEAKFLFVYTKETQCEDFFQDLFFKNNANILIIEAEYKNSTKFNIKTNKFVGSFFENPHELLQISQYDALNETFEPNVDLFSRHKLQNLQGREIIVGAFDYRPFVVVDFQRLPQYHDYAEDNPRHLVHIDGTEMRVVHTFCEIYNCSVQADTSEKSEWGMLYPNYTADGLIGMIVEGKTHMGLGAFFVWYIAYRSIDQTSFLGRSGVTCLVPAPTRMSTWALPITPFKYTLWLAVILCLFAEALALFLARLFEEHLIEEQENLDIMSSVEFAYSTTLKLFISQGSDYVVNSHTVRTVLFACYVIDIIVTSVYGGGLSSILTLPDLSEAADSVERLYSHNLTWTATSYDWVALLEDEIEPLYQRLVTNYRISSREEMRSRAKTENMGFALERMAYGHFGNGHFITSEALDRLKLMVDDIYFVFTVAMVPRMWAHLTKYNDLILAWHSSGLSKYWEWKIVADYMNANEQNQVQASIYTQIDTGPVKLDMSNFVGLIAPWIVGIILSIVVFIGELIYYRWRQGKENRQIIPDE